MLSNTGVETCPFVVWRANLEYAILGFVSTKNVLLCICYISRLVALELQSPGSQD